MSNENYNWHSFAGRIRCHHWRDDRRNTHPTWIIDAETDAAHAWVRERFEIATFGHRAWWAHSMEPIDIHAHRWDTIDGVDEDGRPHSEIHFFIVGAEHVGSWRIHGHEFLLQRRVQEFERLAGHTADVRCRLIIQPVPQMDGTIKYALDTKFAVQVKRMERPTWRHAIDIAEFEALLAQLSEVA